MTTLCQVILPYQYLYKIICALERVCMNLNYVFIITKKKRIITKEEEIS
jgi:hypothetical protein